MYYRPGISEILEEKLHAKISERIKKDPIFSLGAVFGASIKTMLDADLVSVGLSTPSKQGYARDKSSGSRPVDFSEKHVDNVNATWRVVMSPEQDESSTVLEVNGKVVDPGYHLVIFATTNTSKLFPKVKGIPHWGRFSGNKFKVFALANITEPSKLDIKALMEEQGKDFESFFVNYTKELIEKSESMD